MSARAAAATAVTALLVATAPTIGESPTRPGTFHASPAVVVTDETSPLALTALQLMVPCGGVGKTSPSGTSR